MLFGQIEVVGPASFAVGRTSLYYFLSHASGRGRGSPRKIRAQITEDGAVNAAQIEMTDRQAV